MDEAREAAVRVVQALTTKLSRADGDGPTCTSTQAQISDEWCETNYLSFPLYCECEDESTDSGQPGLDSSKGQQQEQETIVKPPVQWTAGYYSWSWTNPAIAPNNGTEDSTLGVQFSGEWNVTAALLAVGATSGPCDATQKTWCESQLDFYKQEAKDDDEAKEMALQEYGENCRSCLVTEADKAKPWSHPFSEEAGTYRGRQYLSLGGSRSIEAWRPEFLDAFTDGGGDVDAIKDAGFAGVCFDIEETNGGKELITAFERTFAVLKKAGLDVMASKRPRCTSSASSLHPRCTLAAPSLHPRLQSRCTLAAPSLHLLCTLAAPSLHPRCTFSASSLHLLCTLTAPSLLPAAGDDVALCTVLGADRRDSYRLC